MNDSQISPFDDLSVLDNSTDEDYDEVPVRDITPLHKLDEDAFIAFSGVLENVAKIRDIASLTEKSSELTGLSRNCEVMVWDCLAKKAGFVSIKEAIDNDISLSLKTGCFIYAERKQP
jgi:hypothetical protein